MKETKKWAAALLAGAAAVGAAAAGLAFWSRKKHKALKLGKPESQPPEEQTGKSPGEEAPGGVAPKPAAGAKTKEAEEASHDE